MYEIQLSKTIITVINIIILMGLPLMFWWHVRQARKKDHLSEDWMMQIIIIFTYGVAICAEIPALWVRWVSYYQLNIVLPEGVYKLSTWDRWNHACFYVVLFLLTHTFTKKKVPKIIRDTLS